MNYKQLRTLYKKEIMDVLRDKKTVFTMIVLPIILYPILFLVGAQIMTMINKQQEEQTYHIAYDGVSDERRQELNDWIAGDEDDFDYIIEEVESNHPKQDLEDENIDAYITVAETEEQVIYEIHYLFSVTNSSNVSDMLKDEIDAFARKKAEENAEAAGLNVTKMLYPVTTKMVNLSSGESAVGSILGGIIPFLLITSILLGSMYPAIDATAGEKERGTLETLLTLPIGNMELIMSKFLSVATLAVVSVFMNVVSMGFVAGYLYATISSFSEAANEFHIESFIPAILISVVCIMAFALLMSAVVMCVCAFAKSFKEANNYVTPLTLVVMLTGYIGLIPNVELDSATALIPVVNICLLMKNLLVFKYNFDLILLVLLSNIIYAFIAIWFLSKIYNSESILFGESMSGMKLFERRKNLKKGTLPSIQDGMLILVVALLLLAYVGGIMSLKQPVVGAIVPQLFLGLLPILACVYIKGDAKKIFSLNVPHGKDIVGAVCLLLGAGSVSQLMLNLLEMWFPNSSQGVNEQFSVLLKDVPFVPAVLLIALVPAVCEELMFRGYLFTAFRQKMNITKAILIVSVLFGISHLSLSRFLPTALIGTSLAYAAYKADSIVVSALMHFLNNAFSTFILYYGNQFPILNEEHSGLPLVIGMVAVAGFFIPLGIRILNIQKK